MYLSQVGTVQFDVESVVGWLVFHALDSGEPHELVVARARSADALPTDSDGAVDEEQLPEGALIGEIEDIEAASSKSVTNTGLLLRLGCVGCHFIFAPVAGEERRPEREDRRDSESHEDPW